MRTETFTVSENFSSLDMIKRLSLSLVSLKQQFVLSVLDIVSVSSIYITNEMTIYTNEYNRNMLMRFIFG